MGVSGGRKSYHIIMAVHIKDIDDLQVDFQTGTLTDVEADAGGFLRFISGGEIGTFSTASTSTFTYETVNLSRSYNSPLVFALMNTYNGTTASVARVNNVSSNSFDLGIAEANQPTGINNGHTTEDVSYLVLEDRGRYQSFDNRTVEVGTVDISATNANEATAAVVPWVSVAFSSPFASTPIVLAQVQTENNGYVFLKCRITAVTTTGFDVVLERHGANTVDSLTNAEVVAWVAIEQGTGTEIEVGTFDVAGDLDAATIWDTLSFTAAFSSAPIFIGWDQTTSGQDSNQIRCKNLLAGSVDITCEEDSTFDTELNHATETVGYIAFAPSFLWYKDNGNRVSPQLDLSVVGTVESSLVSWTQTLNGGTITIETRISTDNGATWSAWKPCTNGGAIPDLPYGTDASTALLECRQSLSTSDPTVTPQLESLTLEINSQKVHAANLNLECSTVDLQELIQGSVDCNMDISAGNKQISILRAISTALDVSTEYVLSGPWWRMAQEAKSWERQNQGGNSWTKVSTPSNTWSRENGLE
jgi:hypothetical protein